MLKTISGIILIMGVIIFMYPMENMIVAMGTSIFINDHNSDGNLIKGFGNVKIENYKEYKELGADAYCDCKAIYFNEEQANKIEMQIGKDEKWTSKPFKDKFFNDYKKFNVNDFGKSYYYLVEFDRNYNIIETNRAVLDNKKMEWYVSAIYDSDNKILYYYNRHYQK